MVAAGAVAAIMDESNLDIWATDGEEETDTSNSGASYKYSKVSKTVTVVRAALSVLREFV